MVCRTDTAGIALTDRCCPRGITRSPSPEIPTRTTSTFSASIRRALPWPISMPSRTMPRRGRPRSIRPRRCGGGFRQPTPTISASSSPENRNCGESRTVGQAAITISAVDASGEVERSAASADDANQVQMSDLYLVPGNHWLRVQGEAGGYTDLAVWFRWAARSRRRTRAERFRRSCAGASRRRDAQRAAGRDGGHRRLPLLLGGDGARRVEHCPARRRRGEIRPRMGNADARVRHDRSRPTARLRCTVAAGRLPPHSDDRPAERGAYRLELERLDRSSCPPTSNRTTQDEARPLPQTLTADGPTVNSAPIGIPAGRATAADIVIHYQGTGTSQSSTARTRCR